MSDAEGNNGERDFERKSESVDSVSQEEIVDPRVQIELERLNTATDLINKLEIELDEARSNFRLLLSESSLRVNQLAKKIGSCVEKARPYYESRMKAKQLQTQTQKAALRYERASSAHSAAKEMVYLAEEGLKKEGRCFDPAWQEMLNHATLRVNEAESERVLSQHEHQKTSSAYNEAEKVVQQLHQELKKSIVKSRPYFEMKAQFNQLLEEQRKKVHHLEENVLKMKMSYSDALHNLEEISDEIHEKRKAQENQNNVNNRREDTETNSTYMWEGLKIPYHRMKNSHTSCDDIFTEHLNHEEVYMSLPSKISARTAILAADGAGHIAKANLVTSSHLPTSQSSQSLDDGTQGKECSSEVMEQSEEALNSIGGKSEIDVVIDNGSNYISKREKLNLPDEQYDNPSKLSAKRNVSPEEDASDHKFLAPDFNILRVQREEISDSESLASNDTADTLDDNQIECLLLDKVLPLDAQEVDEDSMINCQIRKLHMQ